MLNKRLGAYLAIVLGVVTGNVPAADEGPYIVLQSTTSTRNSGLFDYLLPLYQREFGVEIRAVAVGTGQALNNARKGDGDVLLVHAKPAEEEFVVEGFGVERFDLMYNDFVIVGPGADPAGIHGGVDVVEALVSIDKNRAAFASRGDDSGTHQKELALWREAGIAVSGKSGDWYRETGSGMGATLNVATGTGAYCMTDRATWISFRNKGDLVIHVAGDPQLFNQYGVILVNPAVHPHVKADAAEDFIEWLLSPEGQAAIAAFKVDGEQLFYPNAKAPAEND